MIATTIRTDRPSAISTSWIAPLMKVASSEVTKMRTSCGRSACSPATISRTAFEISSVLLWACRMIPRPTPFSPFARR